MKTVVPKPEDATASVRIKPVHETSASSKAPPSQPPVFDHSGYSNSSASSGMFLACSCRLCYSLPLLDYLWQAPAS